MMQISGDYRWVIFVFSNFPTGASHCEDMRDSRSIDNDELKNARTEIKRVLDGWLKGT